MTLLQQIIDSRSFIVTFDLEYLKTCHLRKLWKKYILLLQHSSTHVPNIRLAPQLQGSVGLTGVSCYTLLHVRHRDIPCNKYFLPWGVLLIIHEMCINVINQQIYQKYAAMWQQLYLIDTIVISKTQQILGIRDLNCSQFSQWQGFLL